MILVGRKMITEIKENTNILFQNVEELLNSISDSDLAFHYNEWTIGDQFLHMFKSMSIWFINPSEHYLDYKYDALNKKNLSEYYLRIKEKIIYFQDSLQSNELQNKPENCKYSKLELLFGQTRHIMYHLGLINGLLCIKNSKKLIYKGL